jgi:alcohol dehydrogenase class IV
MPSQFPLLKFAGSFSIMKTASIIALLMVCSPLLNGADRDKPSAPIIIPLTGSGQATTSKLGNAYIIRDSKTEKRFQMSSASFST